MFINKIKEKVIEEVEDFYDTTKKDYVVKLKLKKGERSISPQRQTNQLKKWASKNH